MKIESLFEWIYKWRNHDIAEALCDIYQVRNLTNGEFRQWQENKKWKIARYHYNNNPFYHQMIGEPFPDTWTELSIIQKSNIQISRSGLISLPYREKRLYKNKTSGSSGQPFSFVKDYYTQARVWAYKKLFYQMHGVDLGSKEAKFYRSEKRGKKRVIELTKDFILNRHRFPVSEMCDASFVKWIDIFRKSRFKYIYGYTSAIVLFSRFVIQQGMVLNDICPTLKIVIVTSETCTVEDKEIIERATGVKVRNEYGTADVGLIGYECQEGHIHLAEENIFVETDVKGELIVTDLFNKAFPFIRYRLGDLATISGRECECKDKNRYLLEFQGRANDFVFLGNEKKVSGYAFYQEIRPILEKPGILKEFFIRQTDIDKMELDIVAENEYCSKVVEEIQKSACEFLGKSIEVKLIYMQDIERPASGKLKHFYSELGR